VYYGPGLSGKTTNLQVVHQKVPQNTRGKLISLATEADRTLYFDFLPINIGSINGFAAKFQLYTVPGQVYYNATRKLVLRGVDGVVFVADSQADKHDDNMESLSNLIENLQEYGYDVNELPIVIQYNKTDLPTALPKEELDEKLNERGWPSYTAAAVDGVGVFDTLKAIMKLVLEKAKKGGTGASAKPKVLQRDTAQPAPQAVSGSGESAMTAPAQSVAVPTAPQPEPAMAAVQEAGASGGVDTQPVDAVAQEQEQPDDTAPVRSHVAHVSHGQSSPRKGGLFGAPRSTGRVRHTSANVTGPTSVSGPVGHSQESTGRIETADTGPVSHGNSGTIQENNDTANVQHTESLSAATSQQAGFGHDPLEQTPPQSKQKKAGFFRRLFGRK